ncbi:hypothetical protein HDV57DRAFT_490154 [Trichoderma longibrachiatum]|uniref:Ribosome biogenesis protein SLX9 n=1 Tax=Trichoderma longibrachiatum ATCC 18648 TaxID=983965 RepID=A0A2T4C488_TRILO|nr:hypothetical protein M440DRAFT_1251236 [Trichoderma longibrachiatum ATCC 18648]
MAPQKPSATALRHARITNSIHPLAPPKTFRPNASTTDSFLSSKRDKRIIKHSAFVSRVASSSKITKTKTRRRGSAKSKTQLSSLDSLADALPELADGEGAAEILDGKIKHQSLRSKKGALKRKERLLRGEMARFGMSLAQLATVPAAGQQAQGTAAAAANQPVAETQQKTEEAKQQPAPAVSNRWAALRGYISATMEQNPAFVNKN